jgi:hypothetical protein
VVAGRSIWKQVHVNVVTALLLVKDSKESTVKAVSSEIGAGATVVSRRQRRPMHRLVISLNHPLSGEREGSKAVGMEWSREWKRLTS